MCVPTWLSLPAGYIINKQVTSEITNDIIADVHCYYRSPLYKRGMGDIPPKCKIITIDGLHTYSIGMFASHPRKDGHDLGIPVDTSKRTGGVPALQ